MNFPRVLGGIGSAFYVVACALLTGAALYLPALGFLQHAGLHEDFAGPAMPLGAMIGGPLAFRLRKRTWPCGTLIFLGMIAVVAGLMKSATMFEESRHANGGAGAGIGELIAGYIFAGMAICGGIAIIAGVVGWLAVRARVAAEKSTSS